MRLICCQDIVQRDTITIPMPPDGDKHMKVADWFRKYPMHMIDYGDDKFHYHCSACVKTRPLGDSKAFRVNLHARGEKHNKILGKLVSPDSEGRLVVKEV